VHVFDVNNIDTFVKLPSAAKFFTDMCLWQWRLLRNCVIRPANPTILTFIFIGHVFCDCGQRSAVGTVIQRIFK